jgi:pimeloyl-ACP methyl ester carboxylesterase
LQVHAQSEIGRNFERAFGVIVDGCKVDPECSAAYPNFETDFWENVRMANADPIVVTISDRAGDSVELHISGNTLISGVFVAMYSSQVARVLPFANDLIAKGNNGVLQVLAQELVFVFSGFADAMTISVDCNEEVPFVTADVLAAGNADVRPEVIAADIANISTEESRRGAVALCETWGTPPADPIEKQAVRSNIPALILGGAHDPITPPPYGALAAETLSNSYFFEFPASGHGVFYHQWDCATPMIDAFLSRPSAEPDASCIDDVAPIDFAVDTAPAPAPPAPNNAGTPGGIVAPDTGTGEWQAAGVRRGFWLSPTIGAAMLALGWRLRRRAT